MGTKLWEIEECPGYTVEQTPGAWALWGPCVCIANNNGESNDDCPSCGRVGEVIKAACGMNDDGTPSDPHMLHEYLPSATWTAKACSMTDYEPEVGDLVDVSCETYCGAQGNLHAISPLLRGKRGVVEYVESPDVNDHIYRVRFQGPEWATVEANPGQGVRMYFKLSELQKVEGSKE